MSATTIIWPSKRSSSGLHWNWTASLLLYVLFAGAVFVIQGQQPLLGPDHVTYFQLADSIIDAHPAGDYWRESNSVRSFGVLLAYLHPSTGSHLLSMKIMLAIVTVAYLLSAELFFSLFAAPRWQRVLFALVSAFAVSFGISSWGVTDSTALLSRSLVAPIVMLSVWFWFRFYEHPIKYLAFSFLVLGSLLHLSSFYVVGILCFLEVWDFFGVRHARLDARVPAFLGGMLLSAALLYGLESTGLSVGIIHATIPQLFASKRVAEKMAEPEQAVVATPPGQGQASSRARHQQPAGKAAATADVATPPTVAVAAPINASEAWALELRLRPWRNMPLQWANVANVLSSFMLILVVAVIGIWRRKQAGFTTLDRAMIAMFVAVPVFSFLPQTLLWVLRSFTQIYPVTLEEVRAIGFVMIPALYFAFRLFQQILAEGKPRARARAAAVLVAVLALPLLTKSLPVSAREGIFSGMTALGVVKASDPGAVANARAALGISHVTPFYYSTLGLLDWFQKNTPAHTRILTDRDEFVLLRDHEIVGARQVAAVPARAGIELPDLSQIYFETVGALHAHDLPRLQKLAARCGAEYIVVPWAVPGAVYSDAYFSIVPVTAQRSG